MFERCEMCIQDTVLLYALRPAGKFFSIAAVQLWLAIERGILLSYKQVRDALYRLRCAGLSFRHLARGVYQWV